MNFDKNLLQDIFQWNVQGWKPALLYWDRTIDSKTLSQRNHDVQPRALEIGADQGGLSIYLALKGFQVVGSDFRDVPDPLLLRDKYKVFESLKWMQIDAREIPFPDSHFDVVAFRSVLGGIYFKNGLEGVHLALREMLRVLKPGGFILFSENLAGHPLHQFLRNRVDKTWRYPTLPEFKSWLDDWDDVHIHATGFLSPLGRSEGQRSLLAFCDLGVGRMICDRFKLIGYGSARKARDGMRHA